MRRPHKVLATRPSSWRRRPRPQESSMWARAGGAPSGATFQPICSRRCFSVSRSYEEPPPPARPTRSIKEGIVRAGGGKVRSASSQYMKSLRIGLLYVCVCVLFSPLDVHLKLFIFGGALMSRYHVHLPMDEIDKAFLLHSSPPVLL